MKTNLRLFYGFALFYLLMTIIYWLVGGEAVGITAMGLSSGLAALVAFYLWYAAKNQGGTLPEDNLEGEIADSAGELGFFSPHSWWPLPVAFSACLAGLGLVIGWWLALIGIGALVVSIIGFVTQYETPSSHAEHH
jgi:hypothetical protein